MKLEYLDRGALYNKLEFKKACCSIVLKNYQNLEKMACLKD
jgi:hypothetical protein